MDADHEKLKKARELLETIHGRLLSVVDPRDTSTKSKIPYKVACYREGLRSPDLAPLSPTRRKGEQTLLTNGPDQGAGSGITLMLYLLAFFFPWLSLFLVMKPIQAAINFLLWVLGIALIISLFAAPLGIALGIATFLHAIFVVHGARADRRTAKIVDAISAQKSAAGD